MLPSFRQSFNSNFAPAKYQQFKRTLADRCGMEVPFRVSETPCFFPAELIRRLGEDGKALIRQLVDSPEYHNRSEASLPAQFRVPNESPRPMFVQVDFGLVRDKTGTLQPKLVELQAFPSLYAYQGPLAQAYIDVYELESASPSRPPASGRLKYLLSGLESDAYRELLRRAIVGSRDPENVILMEIDPHHQK